MFQEDLLTVIEAEASQKWTEWQNVAVVLREGRMLHQGKGFILSFALLSDAVFNGIFHHSLSDVGNLKGV